MYKPELASVMLSIKKKIHIYELLKVPLLEGFPIGSNIFKIILSKKVSPDV